MYEETPNKVFENPIEIDALVKYEPQDIRSNTFGSEEFYTIEAYIQKRDIIDKGIILREGDFFSYGEVFFEVIKVPDTNTIYGQIEYKSFVTITGKQSRKGQFRSTALGPTSETYTDPDAVQDTFVQQRGFNENSLGKTGDVRELQRKGVLDEPISGPAEVSKQGDTTDSGSSFYGDDC